MVKGADCCCGCISGFLFVCGALGKSLENYSFGAEQEVRGLRSLGSGIIVCFPAYGLKGNY